MTGKLALHSVSYAGLWEQAFLPLDAFIGKSAELGFDGVMLMAKRPHLSVLDYGPKELAALRALADRHSQRVLCLAGYTNFTADLEHGDIPHGEMQIQHVTQLASMARDLDCSLVRVFTGYDHAASGPAAQWKMVVRALKECARRASDFGVTIGVQNHHDIAAGFESHADLIREVGEPNCKALFDAWAPALQGSDLCAGARLLASLTAHTTLANYLLRPRFRYDAGLINYTPQLPAVQAVPMKEGFIPYKQFLSQLALHGFHGSIGYEMCSPLRDGSDIATLDRYARLFLEFMRP